MQAATEDDPPQRLNMREAETARIAATPEELDPRAIMLLPANDERRVRFEAQAAQRLQEAEAAHAAAQKAEPQVDPRTALRAEVARHSDLTRRLRDLAKALPTAEAAVMAAKRAVEAATASREDANKQAGSRAAAVALGSASKVAPPSIANARAKLADAEDDLAARQA